MAKNDHNTSVKKDLFSYLLGKNQSGTYQEYTGTSLSINNTKKGKMKLDLYGNASQVSYTGRNLVGYNNSLPYTNFDLTLARENDNYKTTGTASGWFYKKIFEIPANSLNGTYLVKKIAISGTSTAKIRIIDRTVSPAATYAETDTQATFTISNNNTLAVEITVANGASSNEIFNILMQLSSIADTSYEPYVGGTASPNPSYPQTIHSVSGDNTIKVCGKNYFNINGIDDISSASYKINIVNDTIVITDNTISSGYTNAGKKLKDLCPSLKVNDVVYLFFNTTSSVANKNYIYLNAIWSNGSSKTITQEMLDSDLQLYGGYNETAVISNFMITKTNDNNYQPYTSATYPITLGSLELNKIGTYQDRFLRNSGKNLFDKDTATIISAYFDNNTTTITSSGTNKTTYWEVQPNTTYAISKLKSVRGFIGTTTTTPTTGVSVSNVSLIGYGTYDGRTRDSGTITTGENDKYIVINYTNTNSETGDIPTYIFDSIMINKGSTALPYEPYGTGEWYLEKKIKKVTLDGTENVSGATTYGNNKRFSIIPNNYTNEIYYPGATPVNCMCNKLQVSYLKAIADEVATTTTPALYCHSSAILINMTPDYNISTKSAMVSWLETNQPIVYFILKTPTYTQITDTTLISQLEAVYKSYKDQTNINQVNDDLPFELKVKVKVSS